GGEPALDELDVGEELERVGDEPDRAALACRRRRVPVGTARAAEVAGVDGPGAGPDQRLRVAGVLGVIAGAREALPRVGRAATEEVSDPVGERHNRAIAIAFAD